MTREEAEEYFATEIEKVSTNDEAVASWGILREQALAYMDQGFDPDMVMFALKVAIEGEKEKRGVS